MFYKDHSGGSVGTECRGPGWKLEDYLGGYCGNPGEGQHMNQSAEASDKPWLNVN